MRLLTLGEAIEETESMWRCLASKRGNIKPDTVWLHDCPCCEYVYQKHFGKPSEGSCIMTQTAEDYEVKKLTAVHDEVVILCINDCPLKDLWPDGCESPSSPYHKWGDIYDDTSEYAEEIADFAKKLMEVKYCDDCLNLTPTEEEQDKLKTHINHWCRRLKRRILHKFSHPRLPRPAECDDYKKRIEK